MEGREEVADVLAFPLVTLRYMFLLSCRWLCSIAWAVCPLENGWVIEGGGVMRIGTLHSRSLRLTGKLSFLSETSMT